MFTDSMLNRPTCLSNVGDTTGAGNKVNPSIVSREEHHHRRNIREALEIIKHPHNLNRDNGIEISGSWLPLMREIKITNTS